MTTKYAAKHVYWDTNKQIVRSLHDVEIYRCNGKLKLPLHYFRFDSQHEFKVYLELVRMYGEHRIKRQVSERLLPSCRCYPRGKYWKIDFAITDLNNPKVIEHYVEAKGVFLPSFGDTLAAFETNNRYRFKHLYLVFPREIPIQRQVVRNLFNSDDCDRLMTLKDLKQLTELS